MTEPALIQQKREIFRTLDRIVSERAQLETELSSNLRREQEAAEADLDQVKQRADEKLQRLENAGEFLRQRGKLEPLEEDLSSNDASIARDVELVMSDIDDVAITALSELKGESDDPLGIAVVVLVILSMLFLSPIIIQGITQSYIYLAGALSCIVAAIVYGNTIAEDRKNYTEP